MRKSVCVVVVVIVVRMMMRMMRTMARMMMVEEMFVTGRNSFHSILYSDYDDHPGGGGQEDISQVLSQASGALLLGHAIGAMSFLRRCSLCTHKQKHKRTEPKEPRLPDSVTGDRNVFCPPMGKRAYVLLWTPCETQNVV